MPEIPANHIVTTANIASHGIIVVIAALLPEGGERALAHKRLDCRWDDMRAPERSAALADVVRRAAKTAEVEIHSLAIALTDASMMAAPVQGFAVIGEDVKLGQMERSLALRRAREQATGADREVADLMATHWTVRSSKGEIELDDPVGQQGHSLVCHALRASVRRGTRSELSAILETAGFGCDGLIAQPFALYRGIAGRLSKGGSVLVIDCGARHTAFLVQRRGRLVHAEVHGFGGEDLTARIADGLSIDPEQAEAIKREIDVSAPVQADESGQMRIWTEGSGGEDAKRAARLSREALVSFFAQRAHDLREHGHLAQTGRIHLVGRGAALRGLPRLVNDAFELATVLGSGASDRDPDQELENLLVAGLTRCAGELRREQLAADADTLTGRASGLWAWLTAEMR